MNYDLCRRGRVLLGPRDGIQHRLQLTDLSQGELAPGTADPFRGQRGPAVGGQRPPPRFTDIRDTRNCFATSRSPAPRLDQLRRGQPHLLPAGPLLRRQPAAIWVPHDSGYRAATAITRGSNLQN